jgi:hypothetical protein
LITKNGFKRWKERQSKLAALRLAFCNDTEKGLPMIMTVTIILLHAHVQSSIDAAILGTFLW